MKLLYLFSALIVTLTSCLMRQPEQHSDFMAHSDCMVYKNEVISEPIAHGRVEYINMSEASECAKEQLKNVYLLYYDSLCIAVYNTHPKASYKLIEQCLRKYQSDNTRLASFVKLDDSLRLHISRLCEDRNEMNHYGTYVDWKVVYLKLSNNKYNKKKETLITNWCNWKD